MSEMSATDDWFSVHDAYHKASRAYNERLALVRAERERGNWSMDVNAEYQALCDAQRVALSADETLYRFLKAEADVLVAARSAKSDLERNVPK